MYRRTAFDQKLNQSFASPTTGPSQRSGTEQIIAQIEFRAVIEQHSCEAHLRCVTQVAVTCSDKMQDCLTEALNIWVDSVPQKYGHATKESLVVSFITALASRRLHQDPVPSLIIERPLQMREGQRNDLWTTVICGGPEELMHYVL